MITQNINRILAEWNPIGVEDDLAIEEYKGYIPLILDSLKNRQILLYCLEQIVVKMDVGYDSNNP